MKELRLLHYLREHACAYAVAFVALCIGIVLDMISPQIVRHIVDDVLIGKKIDMLPLLLSGILAVGVGRCIFMYVKEFLCDYAGSKIGGDIRLAVFQKLQSLSANFFDGVNSGELMSRVKDDVDSIWDIFTYIAILIIEVVVHTAIVLYFMYSLNWKLSIIPTLSMMGAATVAILMERKLDSVYETIAQENSVMNNTAAENLAGIRTVQAFVRMPFENRKFMNHNRRYYELNINRSKVFVKYNPILQCITYLLPCSVLLLGGFFAINGSITIGELTAFIEYSMNIVWPMELLGWLTNGISAARISKQRLNKIFEQEPDIQDCVPDITAGTFNGAVDFEHVCYKGSNGKEILHDVSFHIAAGQTLGIMGATGAGKTTIINLLKRMYNVSGGSIKLDGIDIRHISLPQLRCSIACVMQDVFLFSDTIGGNVKLGGRDYLDNAAVIRALDDSCSKEFVDAMKDGTETVIGERGVGLSGGQKQRLTIARALSRKAPVLVFDDSMSALDTETEQLLQRKLAELSGMTKIIIAHRISAVRDADEIIVLENGKIAERGNHEQLMARKGMYFKTYQSQS